MKIFISSLFVLIWGCTNPSQEAIIKRVKTELKYPDTANFQTIKKIWTAKEGQSEAYYIMVESKNSLGDMVSVNYCACIETKEYKKLAIHKGCDENDFYKYQPLCYPSYFK